MYTNRNGSIVLGFTFTIMIATSIMFYFKETELQNQMNLIKRESLIINLDMARYAIEKAFEDPRVVTQTFHAAANQTGTVGMLACLSDPTTPCENIEKDLTLVGPVPGKLISNPAVLSNGLFFGFSFKAAACTLPECANLINQEFLCTTFEPSNAAEDCVFRLRTTWKPLCPSLGPCLKPKIVWMLRLEKNTASRLRIGPINPSRYYVEKTF